MLDAAHPAYGQNGLFASAGFGIGDVLGEYTGKVCCCQEPARAPDSTSDA